MAEAGGEPFEAQKAVAQVILDRVEDKGFPNSIHAVVKQPRQFTPVSRGSLYRREPSEDVKKAIEEIFDEGARVTDEPLLYFMNEAAAEKNNIAWFRSSLDEVVTIGKTTFFKERNGFFE